MNRERALRKIARDISRCVLCKKGGTGKAVAGEGSADATIVFVGEAPGKEEAKIGRPFIGRSGKFLRKVLADIGLHDREIFITSPVHYLPLRGTPSRAAVIHGREHLYKQIEIIDPKMIVLLGNTACSALLDSKQELSKEHGKIIRKDGRKYFITFHPAYAMRFPEGKKQFISDFKKLKKLIKSIESNEASSQA
jgi:DNA polymerase